MSVALGGAARRLISVSELNPRGAEGCAPRTLSPILLSSKIFAAPEIIPATLCGKRCFSTSLRLRVSGTFWLRTEGVSAQYNHGSQACLPGG